MDLARKRRRIFTSSGQNPSSNREEGEGCALVSDTSAVFSCGGGGGGGGTYGMRR